MERGQECPRNIGHGRLPHQQGAPGHWASVPHAQQQLHYHLARDSVEEPQMDEQNLRAFLILRLCDLLSQPRLQGQSHSEGSAHTPSSPVHGGLGGTGAAWPLVSHSGSDDKLSSKNMYPSFHSTSAQARTVFPSTPGSVCGHGTTSHQ